MNNPYHILLGDLGYDGQNLLGVYSTLKEAKMAVMGLENRFDYEGFKTIQMDFNAPAFEANWAYVSDNNDSCQVRRWYLDEGGVLQSLNLEIA